MPDGTERTLNMGRLADRFVCPDWGQTGHARSLYVALSRARDQAFLYTDDCDQLTAAVAQHSGAQAAALDHDME